MVMIRALTGFTCGIYVWVSTTFGPHSQTRGVRTIPPSEEVTAYESRSRVASPQWKYVQFGTKMEVFQTLHNCSLRNPKQKPNLDALHVGMDYGFYGLGKGLRKQQRSESLFRRACSTGDRQPLTKPG